MTSVRLEKISKRFGTTIALDGVNLKINAGELFFLLGPSGCGKSTLLRIIAGLETPTAGSIWFNDRDVTELATEKRNAVMCFQSYALWPHMTVAENIRFGLRVRQMRRAQQEQKVEEMLRLVQMETYAQRKPNQLSGGQQQRVALARALAVNPDCLLLDEPLSNLDAKLRHEMRNEIRRICKEGGFTTIYVTHDQKEALSVADRLAVMHAGNLAQVGTPDELYHRPISSFVAGFVGATNLLNGQVVERNGKSVKVKTQAGIFSASGSPLKDGVILSIRPEQIRVASHEGGINRFEGEIRETTFLGEASEHVVEAGGARIRFISTPPRFGLTGKLALDFDPVDAVVLSE
jgi:iron(III) transport system ATP-binding protein